MMTSGSKSRMSVTCRSVMPAGHRDDGAAQRLGAVVRAEAAGEQPVAVGDVHLVARPAAAGADRPRHDASTRCDVLGGVADDGRAAGRARGCVDARDLVLGHGEHAERVVVAQVALRGEGEPGEVGQLAAVVGMHAGRVERAPVVGDVVVGVAQRPPQPLQLQGPQLVERGALDRIQRFRRRG